jgi:tyrosine-protein phosphatase SIW14
VVTWTPTRSHLSDMGSQAGERSTLSAGSSVITMLLFLLDLHPNGSMPLMTRNTLGFAIVALLAATMCATAYAQRAANASRSPTEAEPSIARKLTLQGVSNLGEVTTTLYRGGQPTKEGFDNLAKMGISIVVDLRASHLSEREEVTNLRMQYVAIPWHCFHPQDAAFAQFLTLLRENPGKKVFVHCRLGHDRTGMMIAAYRMAEQGWTAEEARKEMEAYGFSFGYRMICPGLSSYEEKFPGQFKTSPAFKSLRPSEHTPAPRP